MKKVKLIIFPLICVLLSLLGCSRKENTQTNAPPAMFLNNPQHQAVYKERAVTGFEKVKWNFQTSGRISSSPIQYQDTLYFGSEDYNFYALDIITGAEKWHFTAGDAILSTAAAANGIVYITSNNGHLYALDSESGKKKWEHTTTIADFNDGWCFYSSSPVIADDVIYYGGSDTSFYALDAKTGKELWKYSTQTVIKNTAALHNDTVYFGSYDGVLYALNAKDGKEKWTWKSEFSAPFIASPTVVEDSLYIGSKDQNIYSINAITGKVNWQFQSPGSWVISTPLIHNGILYAGSSDAKCLHALDTKTGKELWNHPTKGRVFSSPIIAEDTLYFGDHDGLLYALDIKARKELWKFQTDNMINSTPLVYGNTIFIGSFDGYMYAIE